jgi:F0F1-type ATP synthase assembly protein I
MLNALFLIVLVAIVGVIIVLVKKYGFKQAWGMIVALLVAIGAAFATFYSQLVGAPMP